ncbi:hypothetical protein [Nostoc sp. TCL240-02]|nr:hypothetical protein [Nostoc sp. TCL240-02]
MPWYFRRGKKNTSLQRSDRRKCNSAIRLTGYLHSTQFGRLELP